MLNYNEYKLPKQIRQTRPVTKGLVIQELENRNHPYEVRGSLISFRNAKGKRAWYSWSSTSLNTAGSRHICLNKLATKAFLHSAGISVPRGDVFQRHDFAAALRYADYMGFPVVVKPYDGVGGESVFSSLQSHDQFRAAWNAQSEKTRVLVEKHVEGEDFRVLMMDGDIRAIVRRDPPMVVGDGYSTVAELVEKLNQRRQASGNPIHIPIKLKGIVADHLVHQGLTAASVCAEGQRIALRSNANISTGGTVTDVTDTPPEPVVQEALKATNAVPGLRVVGLDVLYAPGKQAHLIEMNHNPMLSLHHFPWTGRPRNVVRDLVTMMIKT